jgi:hypothetical protein
MDIIDYLYIRQYCGCKFKFQDLNQYDSFIMGIENQYYTMRDGDYFIQSSSILTDRKNVQEGKIYLLRENNGNSLRLVEFMEAHYKDSFVHLILKDKLSRCIRVLKFKVPETKSTQSPWKIMYAEYLEKEINQQTFGNSVCKNNISSNLDLLEFDY